MTKKTALILTVLSGAYLLTMGPMIDPIPFIDEGVAIAILLKSLSVLGLDLRRFTGAAKKESVEPKRAGEPPIDV